MNTPDDIQHLQEMSELSPEQKRKKLKQIEKRERAFESACRHRMNIGGIHVREFNPDDCGGFSPQYGNVMPSQRVFGR